MPASVEAGSVEEVSGEDFCAATPYTRIASPTGNSTIPAHRNQIEIEKASLTEMPSLKPRELASYIRLGMPGLSQIRAKPRPRMNAPTAISLAFNVDACKRRCLKSALW